jgi:thiol-disulfide isomerase/thioredoxin
MRICRPGTGVLILAVSMCGCSQTSLLRPAPGDNLKTIASVGDKPLPVRSGPSDSSVRAEVVEADLPPAGRGRISGRVYDNRGKAVSGARVRLAVGGESGGKAVSANTDPSGAFTIRGLRPGSSYTLIAEYQGRTGLLTGRAQAKAPSTSVKIGLNPRNTEADDARSTIRPARPSVAPISSIEETDEAEDEQEPRGRINREDVEPPAPEADSVGETERPSSSGARTALGSSAKDSVWSQGLGSSESSEPGAGQGRANRLRPAAAGGTLSRPAHGNEGDDEEENPLPPALEPEEQGANLDQQRSSDIPVLLARGQQASQRPSRRASAGGLLPVIEAEAGPSNSAGSPETDETTPQPLPQGVIAGARSMTPRAYAPILMNEPEPPRRKAVSPTRRPARADERFLNATPTAAPVRRDRPTWGELTFQKPAIPLDESVQKASGDTAARLTRDASATHATAAQAKPKVPAAPPMATLPFPGGVSCQFDASEPRLIDFQLPDAQGRMVSFHDLDSDLILLDFWGTWCVQCRNSIPHLNELQKTLGGKKLQVIGIACEQTPAKDRATKVASSVKQLGINYPVLISGMDRACPVQDAFQIQFYPTMILLDRQGRILRREEGSTDVTLARIDRFIARNLRRPAAPENPAQLARGVTEGR